MFLPAFLGEAPAWEAEKLSNQEPAVCEGEHVVTKIDVTNLPRRSTCTDPERAFVAIRDS